jgi:hypothetical protein
MVRNYYKLGGSCICYHWSVVVRSMHISICKYSLVVISSVYLIISCYDEFSISLCSILLFSIFMDFSYVLYAVFLLIPCIFMEYSFTSKNMRMTVPDTLTPKDSLVSNQPTMFILIIQNLNTVRVLVELFIIL